MNKKFSQSEGMNNILTDFIKLIKKDSDMPELSLSSQKELWDRIVKENKSNERRLIKLFVWSGSVAASICLLIAVGWHISVLPKPQNLLIDYQSVMQSFEPVDETSGNVQLVLSNNRKIHINGQDAQLDYDEEGRVNINNNEKLEVDEGIEDEKNIYNQLVVPAGKRSMLTFNDGTKVWINSNSKLVYPVTFTKHIREIFVEGEIFLDVTRDPERPFIVHTSMIGVKVLGTQFNISAYTDSDCQVALVSGEVEVSSKDNSKEILKPNQLYSYNEEKNDYSIHTVDVFNFVAWKDGYFLFDSQDLGTVLSKLSKYYDVQFQWNEKLEKIRCSGKLDLKDNIQEVLNALEKTAPIDINKTSERDYTVIVTN